MTPRFTERFAACTNGPGRVLVQVVPDIAVEIKWADNGNVDGAIYQRDKRFKEPHWTFRRFMIPTEAALFVRNQRKSGQVEVLEGAWPTWDPQLAVNEHLVDPDRL